VISTSFTRLVGTSLPIQVAAMPGISTPELVAEVADAGALGMVGATLQSPAMLEAMLDELAKRTKGVVGVNFLIPSDSDARSLASRARGFHSERMRRSAPRFAWCLAGPSRRKPGGRRPPLVVALRGRWTCAAVSTPLRWFQREGERRGWIRNLAAFRLQAMRALGTRFSFGGSGAHPRRGRSSRASHVLTISPSRPRISCSACSMKSSRQVVARSASDR
jgi:hypothetical protein